MKLFLAESTLAGADLICNPGLLQRSMLALCSHARRLWSPHISMPCAGQMRAVGQQRGVQPQSQLHAALLQEVLQPVQPIWCRCMLLTPPYTRPNFPSETTSISSLCFIDT